MCEWLMVLSEDISCNIISLSVFGLSQEDHDYLEQYFDTNNLATHVNTKDGR